MNLQKVNKAVAELSRALQAARDVQAVARESDAVFYGSRLTGQLRRASLDCTRALADLRRPS